MTTRSALLAFVFFVPFAKPSLAQTSPDRSENEVSQDSSKPFDVVAHRGFSAVAPENTLAAIKEAVSAGATGCEFDVYACADGTVVLMHDKTVDRTTDGKGPVTSLRLEELKQLDAGSWKDRKYKGEPVPTLQDALKLLKGTNCQPVIEIKVEGIAKQVVDDVRAFDMIDQVAVIAFSQDVVGEVRRLEPAIECAWLCKEIPAGSVVEQTDWLKARARECQAEVVDLNYKLLSPELVQALKARGLGIWTWTVNDVAIVRGLGLWGVESITTDRPDMALRVCREFGAKTLSE